MRKLTLLTILAFTMLQCSKEVIIEFYAKIELIVIDEHNNPIEGAFVKFTTVIENQTVEYPLQNEFTDSEGILVFEEHYENLDTRYHSEKPIQYSERENYFMTDHTYLIQISKDGYLEQTEKIILKDGDDISRTIILSKHK